MGVGRKALSPQWLTTYNMHLSGKTEERRLQMKKRGRKSIDLKKDNRKKR